MPPRRPRRFASASVADAKNIPNDSSAAPPKAVAPEPTPPVTIAPEAVKHTGDGTNSNIHTSPDAAAAHTAASVTAAAPLSASAPAQKDGPRPVLTKVFKKKEPKMAFLFEEEEKVPKKSPKLSFLYDDEISSESTAQETTVASIDAKATIEKENEINKPIETKAATESQAAVDKPIDPTKMAMQRRQGRTITKSIKQTPKETHNEKPTATSEGSDVNKVSERMTMETANAVNEPIQSIGQSVKPSSETISNEKVDAVAREPPRGPFISKPLKRGRHQTNAATPETKSTGVVKPAVKLMEDTPIKEELASVSQPQLESDAKEPTDTKINVSNSTSTFVDKKVITSARMDKVYKKNTKKHGSAVKTLDIIAEKEASQKKIEEEKAAHLKAEEAARVKAEDEALARLKAEEEAARIKAEKIEEAKRLKAEQEAARLKAEEEAARLKAEKEAARLKAEEAARLKAEEEAARLKAEEAARLKAEEEAARLKAEQVAARLKAEEEAALLLAQEQAARRKELREARKKAKEEAIRVKAAEEAARRKARREARLHAKELKIAEEAEARKKAEEEALRQKAEEEEAMKKANEEKAAREKAEAEEAARKKAEEAAKKKAEAEEAAKKKAEAEEAARKKAEAEEAARKKAEAEEAARLKAEAEEEEARIKAKAESPQERRRVAKKKIDRCRKQAESRQQLQHLQKAALAAAEAAKGTVDTPLIQTKTEEPIQEAVPSADALLEGALKFPNEHVTLQRFNDTELVAQRRSLEDPWDIGLRFDWTVKTLAIGSLPLFGTTDPRRLHPFIKKYQSRPVWFLEEVNGAKANNIRDVMDILKKSLTARFVFRK